SCSRSRVLQPARPSRRLKPAATGWDGKQSFPPLRSQAEPGNEDTVGGVTLLSLARATAGVRLAPRSDASGDLPADAATAPSMSLPRLQGTTSRSAGDRDR